MDGTAGPDDLISTRVAADRYNLNIRTLVRWIHLGRLPAYRMAGRWRLSAAELDHFILTARYMP
jgi:excisionase family DNA binding protein